MKIWLKDTFKLEDYTPYNWLSITYYY